LLDKELDFCHCIEVIPNGTVAAAMPAQTTIKDAASGPARTGVVGFMSAVRLRLCAGAAFGLALAFVSSPALPQSGEQKPPPEQQRGQPSGETKDPAKKADEFAEAARLLPGPASNPECVWLGRRVVHLLWRDDLDTAFRHLDLYDRFGCPGGHVQMTFRCVVRQGNIDAKAPESLGTRVHACWINPNLAPPQSAQAPAAPAAQPAPPQGTNPQ
jgi:hypothetical protein